METRHIKDFTLAVVVIILIAFLIHAIGIMRTSFEIPDESIYKDLAIDQQLLAQIQQIEESISDRMDFVFTVTRDPLEQNIVVRTQVDLEQEWREKVKSMIRLAATYVDDRGNRRASIDYQGEVKAYEIGDYIDNNRIESIVSGRVTLAYNGREQILEVEPIPSRPRRIERDRRDRQREYVW